VTGGTCDSPSLEPASSARSSSDSTSNVHVAGRGGREVHVPRRPGASCTFVAAGQRAPDAARRTPAPPRIGLRCSPLTFARHRLHARPRDAARRQEARRSADGAPAGARGRPRGARRVRRRTGGPDPRVPDCRSDLRRLLVDGCWIAAHFVDTGTHRGPFRGIHATGRAVTTPQLEASWLSPALAGSQGAADEREPGALWTQLSARRYPRCVSSSRLLETPGRRLAVATARAAPVEPRSP
jgi:hypothetical protein